MDKLKKIAGSYYYLLTALLMFLSFPSYETVLLRYAYFLAWIFLVPLFCSVRDKDMRGIMLSSFLTGLVGNYLTYGWVGNFGAKEPGGYFVIVVFLIPSLSVFFTIKIMAAEFLSRKFTRLRPLIYPSVWIIVDFIQSVGFLAFPWPYVGYSQYAFTPFIQAASVVGILGINFIIILFNITLTDMVYSMKKGRGMPGDAALAERINFIAVMLLVVAITAAGLERVYSHKQDTPSPELKIGVIQTCISPWDSWDSKKFYNLAELIKHTEGARQLNPDLVIWSESATLEFISYRAMTGEYDDFDARLKDYIKASGIPLLTGEIGVVPRKTGRSLRLYPQNNAVLINGRGEVVQTYPKINLVPFGEWFPYEKWFPIIKRLTTYYGGSDFIPGRKPELFNVKNLNFGALICYEGIFYRLCREYRRKGADFLVNITNDGWTDSYGGHYQHFSAAVFRAIENGLWVVRAGNDGVSAFIDPEGRVTATMPYLKSGHMTGAIYPSRNINTIYTWAGDVVLYMAIIFTGVLAAIAFVKMRKTKGDSEDNIA